jgi:hypothetical protein
VPVLLVFAADLAACLLERVSMPWRSLGGVAAPLMLGLPPLLSSVAFDRIAAQRDTRLQAAWYVSENFRPQTSILICRGYGAPALNQDRRRPPAFLLEEQDCFDGEPPPPGAALLVTHEHQELSFSRIHPALARWLEENGELLAAFDPYRRGARVEPFFYRADAFYIPYAGFEAVERGGPIVRIWKLQSRR